MEAQPKLDHNSLAVQKHLEIVQGVILRTAENSRSCKIWCVTLVAATLVLVARTGEPRHALIALIPTLLFLILDTYYLALERAFRNSYDAFVEKVYRGTLALCTYVQSSQPKWDGSCLESACVPSRYGCSIF